MVADTEPAQAPRDRADPQLRWDGQLLADFYRGAQLDDELRTLGAWARPWGGVRDWNSGRVVRAFGLAYRGRDPAVVGNANSWPALYQEAYRRLRASVEPRALDWARSVLGREQSRLRQLVPLVIAHEDALHVLARRLVDADERERAARRERDSARRAAQQSETGRMTHFAVEVDRRTFLVQQLELQSATRAQQFFLHLFRHPDAETFVEAFARGAPDGSATVVRAIDESLEACQKFSSSLSDGGHDHIWRFPPALVAALHKEGLADIPGLAQYTVAIGTVIAAPWWQEPLDQAGNAVLALELAGPLGAAVAGVLDIALAGTQWLLDYANAAELNRAATATAFAATDERLGQALDGWAHVGALVAHVSLAAVPFLPARGRRSLVDALPTSAPEPDRLPAVPETGGARAPAPPRSRRPAGGGAARTAPTVSARGTAPSERGVEPAADPAGATASRPAVAERGTGADERDGRGHARPGGDSRGESSTSLSSTPSPPRIRVQGLRLDTRTAGTGLIDEIVGVRLPSGQVSVSIEGRPSTGPTIERADLEDTLAEKPGWDRAHLWGRRFGDEAAAGVMYASVGFNRSWQARVENTVLNFARSAAANGNVARLRAVAVSDPADTTVLEEVAYTVWEQTPDGRFLGGWTITLDRHGIATEGDYLTSAPGPLRFGKDSPPALEPGRMPKR